MSYEQGKVMNFKHGHKLLETVDQHKAEIGTVAKDWEDHKTEAFAVGEYVIKDNVTYRFKAAHAANTAWNASEVEATNLGSEITGLKSAIGTVPTGKTVQGQIEALQTGKADMIVVTDSTPAAVMTFQDGADDQPMALKVAVEPVQDLHGYDNPWPEGGGKNLLPMTVNGIKAANTSGTWSGNAYKMNGVTFTVLTNSIGAITGISVNGTASETQYFIIGNFSGNGSFIVNGSPEGKGDDTYNITVAGKRNDVEDNVAFTNDGTSRQVRLYTIADVAITNKVFYPMVRLSTITDATFAPYSNICPISGWTGANVSRTSKNLYGGIKFALDVVNKVQGGSINSENKTVYYAADRIVDIVFFDKFKAETQYTFYFPTDSNATNLKITYTDGTISVISKTSITISTEGKSIASFGGMWNTGTTRLQYEYCGIMDGVCAVDDFLGNKYIGETYNITFPSEAGTVYGGTLTLNQDGTGTLVVDKKCIDAGTINWSKTSTSTNNYEFLKVFDDAKFTSDSITGLVICSHYKEINRDKAWNNQAVGIAMSAPYYKQIIFNDPTYYSYTASEFKTAMSGVQVCYELATPVTYTLTAPQVKTLLGLNNVWADTGDIESVTYPADTKLYIDKLIANLQALVLENIGNT